jgi:azobenzene reductase
MLKTIYNTINKCVCLGWVRFLNSSSQKSALNLPLFHRIANIKPAADVKPGKHTHMINILVISGSTRSGRLSINAAEHVANYINSEYGAQADLLDLAKYRLPVFDDNNKRHESLKTDLETIRNKMLASDGIVVVSPEYNGGMAGSLKNTLDYFRKEYEWRPFGAVSVSIGTLGGQNAMNQLTHFASYVQACLMPNRLLVSEINKIDDDGGASERFHHDAKAFSHDMVRFSKAISESGLRND